MSARRRRLVIRPDARTDLREILLYTQERWGVEQRRRYRTQMYQAMRSLLDYPERGRSREEYFPAPEAPDTRAACAADCEAGVPRPLSPTAFSIASNRPS